MTKIQPGALIKTERKKSCLTKKEESHTIHRSESCLWKSSKPVNGASSHSILLQRKCWFSKKNTLPWKSKADGIRKNNYKTIAGENLQALKNSLSDMILFQNHMTNRLHVLITNLSLVWNNYLLHSQIKYFLTSKICWSN